MGDIGDTSILEGQIRIYCTVIYLVFSIYFLVLNFPDVRAGGL